MPGDQDRRGRLRRHAWGFWWRDGRWVVARGGRVLARLAPSPHFERFLDDILDLLEAGEPEAAEFLLLLCL